VHTKPDQGAKPLAEKPTCWCSAGDLRNP